MTSSSAARRRRAPGVRLFRGRAQREQLPGRHPNQRARRRPGQRVPAGNFRRRRSPVAGRRGCDRLSYDGDFNRSGYEIIGLNNAILSSTTYRGSGLFHIPDVEQAAYLLDTWRIARRLQIMAGFREDWDRQAGSFARSPRVTFAWSPDAGGHTRISGGYSVTTDAANLAVFAPPLDQTAVTTHYLPDGTPGPQGVTTFARGAGPSRCPAPPTGAPESTTRSAAASTSAPTTCGGAPATVSST